NHIRGGLSAGEKFNSLLGPYALVYDEVNKVIVRKAPGTFVLGHKDLEGRFLVSMVSRSDTDVKTRLCDYIGTATQFKYALYPTSKEAFEKECQLFHDFEPPNNIVHPSRPQGTTWECPRCQAATRRRAG
ncbi:MAG: hypothetical protein ACOYLQ_20750, partial [Hyphomicrobiaceae bacterium]